MHLDLLIRRHGTEDNFREALRRKHTKADSANDSILLDETERLVFPAQRMTPPPSQHTLIYNDFTRTHVIKTLPCETK